MTRGFQSVNVYFSHTCFKQSCGLTLEHVTLINIGGKQKCGRGPLKIFDSSLLMALAHSDKCDIGDMPPWPILLLLSG